MSNPFEGFDLGSAREVRIRSYTVGPGRSAQLVSVVLELWLTDTPEPELVEVDYGGDGPALGAVQALVAALNRRLRQHQDEEPSP